MKRNRLMLATATTIAGAASFAIGAPAARPVATASVPAQQRPNILFILIDDMGYGDLSITGNTTVSTPNIDRLAREGLLMTQFYDPAPICSASRAGFLTGRFPARNRFVNFIDNRKHNAETGQADWLDPKVATIPRTLKAAGYATGHFGKWHMGGGRDVGDAPLPTEYGFDESYTQFEGLGPRVLPSDVEQQFTRASVALGRGPIDQLPKAAMTARFVDKAIDFIARSKGKPWFVDVWPGEVHDPFAPSDGQLAAAGGKGRDDEEKRFLASLVNVDRQVGRLVDALRASGQLDSTLIVFTSDNGPIAREGYYKDGATAPGSAGIYRGRKGSLYEGGTRQALIVRWPGRIAAGKRDAVTVSQGVDLFPTLAAVAGARAPASDGVSLLPAWTGKPIATRPDVFWTFGAYGPYASTPRPALPRDRSPSFAIRSGDWKLLADGDGRNAELYDIVHDPSETKNVVAARPAVAKRLTQRLVGWQTSLPLRPSYAKPVATKPVAGADPS